MRMVESLGHPADAYERVTNPQRYRILYAVAEELLDQLVAQYDVERVEGGAALDEELARGVDVRRVVRLAPKAERGASLTVAVTGFPGLSVRFGRWHIEAFPACGCDACDEDPSEVANELREKVEAVADGRFAERLSRGLRPALEYEFRGESWSSSGRRSLTRRHARKLGGAERLDYPSWPRRTAAG